MEALIIEETKGTPRVEFYPEGNLLIQGRSLPLDPIGFFKPIHHWVRELSVPTIHFLIRLEYINSSSFEQLKTIMHILKENPQVKTLNIGWYYEEDDEDSYDTGREFEFSTKIPFTFYAFSE